MVQAERDAQAARKKNPKSEHYHVERQGSDRPQNQGPGQRLNAIAQAVISVSLRAGGVRAGRREGRDHSDVKGWTDAAASCPTSTTPKGLTPKECKIC